MTLLEKIKINLDYLLGKADSSLYANSYKSQNISSDEWEKRFEIFSKDDYFVWYGVDAEDNLAEFGAAETYIPEAFFQDVSINKKLSDFFNDLSEVTTSVIPKNLRYELRQSADNITSENSFWRTGANKGLFIFEELTTEDLGCQKRNN